MALRGPNSDCTFKKTLPTVLVFALAVTGGCDPVSDAGTAPTPAEGENHEILLRNRIFTPAPTVEPFLRSAQTHGVVQFYNRPPGAVAALERLGMVVHGFQRHHAYYVTMPRQVSEADLRSIGVRAVFALRPGDKLGPLLRSSAEFEDPIDVFVSFAADTPRAEIVATLSTLGGVIVRFGMPSLVLVRMPPRTLRALASHDSIWWIEAGIGAPVPLLDSARTAVKAPQVQPAPWGTGVPGYTGAGVNVGIWEVGGGPQFDHPDFGDPGIGPRVFAGELIFDTGLSHATRVTGVLVGNGAASEGAGGAPQQWAGIAPEAIAFAYQRGGADIIGDEVTASHVDSGILVTNHSYGHGLTGLQHCAGVGDYGAYSLSLDEATNLVPVTAVHGAGNEALDVAAVGCEISVFDDGAVVPLDPMVVSAGFGTINGLATSKNAIVVGGRALDLDLSPASSRGPTFDGRLKPDISAIGGTPEEPLTMPGPSSSYMLGDGTSFAAPQVAGGAALLIERYRELENDPGFVPKPAVIKATLLNTAQTVGDRPGYSAGYGVLDLEAAIGAAENFEVVTVADGEQQVVPIPAGPPEACELRVMATWTDPAAMCPPFHTLVNDVDLQLIVPEAVVLPWTLNPSQPASAATRAENHVDNVEQVTVAPVPGGSEAIVSGSVPMGDGQEVVVHWYYAPCDEGADGGTGADEGGAEGGAGCGCSAGLPPAPVAVGGLFLLGGLRRRA